MEKVKRHYENIAANYEESLNKWGYTKLIEDYIEHMNLDIVGNPRILDLGCGTGIAMNKLKTIYPDAEIIGLDLSEKMLVGCRKKMPEVFLLQGDYNKKEFYEFDSKKPYTFSYGSFDIIVSTGSLTEYGQLPTVLPFLYKLLKPEGYLVNIGHQRGLINVIVMHFWAGRSTSWKDFKNKCFEIGFEKVYSIVVPLRKNIWAWRKYGIVAKTPLSRTENIKMEHALVRKKKLGTSFGRY